MALKQEQGTENNENKCAQIVLILIHQYLHWCCVQEAPNDASVEKIHVSLCIHHDHYNSIIIPTPSLPKHRPAQVRKQIWLVTSPPR